MLRSSSQLEKIHRALFIAVLLCFLLCPLADGIGAFIQPTADNRIVSGLTDCWYDYDDSRYTPAVVWTVNPSQLSSYTGKGLAPRADAPFLHKRIVAPALRETRAPPSLS